MVSQVCGILAGLLSWKAPREAPSGWIARVKRREQSELERTAPLRNALIHENVGGANCGKLRGRYGLHRGSTTEAICDKQGVLVTAPRKRKAAEMIDQNHAAWAIGNMPTSHGPANESPRTLMDLAFETTRNPLTKTLLHPNPPVQPFEHGQSACHTHMARHTRMETLHDQGAERK